MSAAKTAQQIVKSVGNTLGQVTNYIGAAVKRIFAPNDDQYPNTGVQPFEGDPNDKKKHRRA